jgi:uncharacterized damage-inducible protein DinB
MVSPVVKQTRTPEVHMGAHTTQFVLFSDYNARFNAQVYDAGEQLTDDERRRDRGAFFGSVHKTLGHILLADRIWLGRFRTCGIASRSLEGADLITTFDKLDDDIFPVWSDLRRERLATDDVITRWSSTLTDDALSTTMRYGNSRGIVREHPAFIAIAHFFNHQTHHRGQVTTLLTQAGLDVGVTDFLAFAAAPVG